MSISLSLALTRLHMSERLSAFYDTIVTVILLGQAARGLAAIWGGYLLGACHEIVKDTRRDTTLQPHAFILFW